jgi:fatty acid desaturase
MTQIRPAQRRAARLSRLLILLLTPAALASLLLVPGHPVVWVLDVLVRTYVMFLGTVMAHEASHGHLGRGAAGNLWWGRLALLPVMVPYANFRKTHPLHHAFTNDPLRDPDHFARPRRFWEIPLRALAMPHQWYVWLKRRERLGRRHAGELMVEYGLVAAVHLPLAFLVGPARYLLGMVPALMLVSLLLWYPFAIKTHEGWSMGRPETRSHDYYGRFMYWFSAGLSLHRAHHLHPELTWLELREHVRPVPARPRRWLPHRSVQAT